jgi:hypothetical protein
MAKVHQLNYSLFMLGKRPSLTVLTLRQRKATGLLLWVAIWHVLLCDTLVFAQVIQFLFYFYMLFIFIGIQSDTTRHDYIIIMPNYN